MLGHEQITSTQVYGNVSIRKLKEAHTKHRPAANLKRPKAGKKGVDDV